MKNKILLSLGLMFTFLVHGQNVVINGKTEIDLAQEMIESFVKTGEAT
jgi:cellobiose-specific phosphotransferase system component IIA